MGCCQHDHSKPEETKSAGGCCGGKSKEKESCCKGSKISSFFKKIFGKKCCGSQACGTKESAH